MIFDTVNVGCLKVLEKGQFDKKNTWGLLELRKSS